MIEVTFSVHSAILNKSFVNIKQVKTMPDFNLYALALYSGNYSIISIKAV